MDGKEGVVALWSSETERDRAAIETNAQRVAVAKGNAGPGEESTDSPCLHCAHSQAWRVWCCSTGAELLLREVVGEAGWVGEESHGLGVLGLIWFCSF